MKSLNKKNFARGACLFSAMLCSMAVTPAMAERHNAHRLQITQEQITGTILDAQNGQPVAGAQITVKGTRITAISDDNGRFTINAKAGAELTISLIGYERQTVRAVEGMKIALKDIGNELGEAVIVGYATQKKANLTGSVAQIKTEELEARPVQNVSSALQGLMPGVSITSGQGRPGQDGSTIRVRGVGTLNNSDPYILVDGVETGTINQIDPNDIESISVLKDAASAAIYGSKASNGVILITTKRGKIGKPVFTYNGNVGILSPTKLVDRINSAEYAEMLNFALTENGKRARFTEEEIAKFRDGSDPDNYPNTDWYDLAFETGIQHSHSFNVSGGTELVKYMASAGYMNQQGILPSSARERFNARANLDFQFTSRLNGRVGINFIKNDYQDPSSNYAGGSSDQIIRQLNIIAPWIVARKSDGTYGTISDGNPIAWLDADQPVKRENQTTTVNLGLDYKILEGLVATANVSHLNANQRYKYFEKYFRYNPNKETSPNNLTEVAYNWTRTGLDLLLNYTKQFGDHGLKLLGGYHAEKYDYSQLSGYRKNFPNNNVTDMNGGDASTGTNGGYSRELNMMSWFGRVNYDYKGRYLFEANLRADASSRFAKGHRWGYFPSFSAAWRISEEDFMQSSRDWLSYLKLRASWGQLGNQDALSEYYPALNTYNLGAIAVFGGTPTPGYYQSNYKMTTISWEKARTWGFGLDFTLFNKVTGSLDYYDRKTTGIIMQVPAPYEFALGSYNDNVGAMSNRGVELSLGYNDRWGDWSFGVQANVSYNKNKILNLGGVTTMSDPNNGNMRREVGKAINSYYMYHADGFFASDADAQAWMDKYKGQEGYPFGSYKFRAGDLIYVDTNNDGKMTADDRQFCNSSTPAWNFGIVLSAGWKNWDAQAIFSGYAKAARIMNAEVYGDFRGDNSHPATIWRESWTYKGSKAEMPRISDGVTSPSHPSRVMSDFWLANTSHLRLKNFQLGYTLPASVTGRWGVSKMRFYYSVENLFTIDAMKVNTDPETASERGSSYPLIMTNSFGVTITF